MNFKVNKILVIFLTAVITIVSVVGGCAVNVEAKTKRCPDAQVEVGNADYASNIANGFVKYISNGKTVSLTMCKGLTSDYCVNEDVHEINEKFGGVGELFCVKIWYDAHKISATSSNSSVVSVSVKKVSEIYLKAKKCGTAVITIKSSCGNKFKIKVKVKNHAYSTIGDKYVKYKYCTRCGKYVANVSSTVTIATDELAQQIHDTIFAQKPFTFYTKGKPNKICNDLKEKIKVINHQGVVFKYSSEKVVGSDDCYKVVIDKGQAEGYYYAIKLAEKILERYKEIFANQCMVTLENWNERYEGEYFEDEHFYTYDEVYESLYADLDDTQRRMIDATGMNELSDLLKLFVISESEYFDCNEESVGIAYVSSWAGYFRGLSEQKILKEIYNNTAKGVCEDYARGEVVFFSYLDIEVKYVSRRPAGTEGHAWTEGGVVDSQGKEYEYRFDYWLYIEVENDSLAWYEELKDILN